MRRRELEWNRKSKHSKLRKKLYTTKTPLHQHSNSRRIIHNLRFRREGPFKRISKRTQFTQQPIPHTTVHKGRLWKWNVIRTVNWTKVMSHAVSRFVAHKPVSRRYATSFGEQRRRHSPQVSRQSTATRIDELSGRAKLHELTEAANESGQNGTQDWGTRVQSVQRLSFRYRLVTNIYA